MDQLSHLPLAIAEPVYSLAKTVGLGENPDQISLVIALLSTLPLGQVFKHIENPTVRHIFSLFFGLLLCFFVVGYGVAHTLIAALVVYFSCALLPRRKVSSFILIGVMAHMSYIHIYRMVTDWGGYRLDASLLYMLFVVKASSFAFNLSDGEHLTKLLKEGKTKADLHKNPKIAAHRAEKALTTLPSLLEFLSYIFFFGSALVGPCFEMRDFLDFMELKPPSSSKDEKLRIPSTILPSLKYVVYALICYVGVFIHGQFPLLGVVDTEDFGNWLFYQKFGYFLIAMSTSRYKYYFVWYLGQAGIVSSGLGWNPLEPRKFDRFVNAHAVAVETAPSMPQLTNHWNMGVNNWLKHYVYFRVPASKGVCNVVTKFTSAMWHGFYPSYYLFFLSAYLLNELDDAIRGALEARLTAYDSNGKPLGYKSPVIRVLYHIFGWFMIMVNLNYLGASFLMLDYRPSINFWKNMYWFGHIIPLVGIFVFRAFRKTKHPHRDQHKKEKEQAATAEKKNEEAVHSSEPRKKRSQKAD